MGRDDLLAFLAHRFVDLAHHPGFDFGPFATHQWHHRAICTQNQFSRSFGHLWPVAFDPFDVSQLHRFIGQSNGLGLPLRSRFAHPSMRKALQ